MNCNMPNPFSMTPDIFEEWAELQRTHPPQLIVPLF